jgi:tetratricopeptide (TPR) repeat protein
LSPYTTEPDQRNVAWSGRLNSYNAYIDAHTNLACLLANMDRLQESYTFCLKAISMNPLNFEAQTNFGDLLRQLGRKDEAIEHTWHQIVKFTNVIDDSYTRP